MKLNIISILLSLLGEGLIALIFFYVIPDAAFASNVRILDFVVVSIAYWLWVYNALKPAVDLNSKSHKQVGGLGIRWAAVTWYTILALLVIAVNVGIFLNGNEPMSFRLQVILQAGLLFLLGAALLSSERSMEKTAQIYEKEQSAKSGKKDVKSAINNLLIEMEDAQGVPDEIKGRVKKIMAETRYIIPSSSSSAREADERMEEDCMSLHALLYDYEMNKREIQLQLGKLERDLERRRQMI